MLPLRKNGWTGDKENNSPNGNWSVSSGTPQPAIHTVLGRQHTSPTAAWLTGTRSIAQHGVPTNSDANHRPLRQGNHHKTRQVEIQAKLPDSQSEKVQLLSSIKNRRFFFLHHPSYSRGKPTCSLSGQHNSIQAPHPTKQNKGIKTSTRAIRGPPGDNNLAFCRFSCFCFLSWFSTSSWCLHIPPWFFCLLFQTFHQPPQNLPRYTSIIVIGKAKSYLIARKALTASLVVRRPQAYLPSKNCKKNLTCKLSLAHGQNPCSHGVNRSHCLMLTTAGGGQSCLQLLEPHHYQKVIHSGWHHDGFAPLCYLS